MNNIDESIDVALRSAVRLNSDRQTNQNQDWQHRSEISDELSPVQIPVFEPRIVQTQPNRLTVAENVWSIMTNKRFRNGPLEQVNQHRSELLGRLNEMTDQARPIEMVLPTIPFKDQSAVTTGQRAEAVDLGEQAMVAQVRDLLQSIETIYPPGGVMHLISDGLVYRDMVQNASDDQIRGYSDGVRRIVDDYGLASQVVISDFSDLVEADDGFTQEQSEVGEILHQRLNSGDSRLTSLQHSMLSNINLPEQDISSTMYLISQPIDDWPDSLQATTASAACNYASFLITASRRQTLSHAFPGSIRATVHPKDAPQVPLNIVNRRSRLLPYNGVPVVDEGDESLRNSLRIVRLASVLGSGNEYRRYISESGDTAYYEQLGGSDD